MPRTVAALYVDLLLSIARSAENFTHRDDV